MFRIAIAAAVVTILTAGNAVAQASRGGHVVGRVTDAYGAVLPGVTVTVSAGNMRRQTVSDTTGRFDVSDVPPGSYDMTAELAGFKRASRRIAVTTPDSVVDASLSLDVAPLCIVDYVDVGFADALIGSAAVFHVRVDKVEPTPVTNSGCTYAALTYTATVIEAIKMPSTMPPLTVRWVQNAWGTTSPVVGEEYLVVLGWDSSHSRFTAGDGSYLFGLRGGGVEWHRDDVPAIHDGDPMHHLIDTIREILASRDRR
jgi:hypothetical protein